MRLLKRKEEPTQTVSVWVPASVKAELNELRQRAEAAGFNLTATLTEALERAAKQIRAELESFEARPAGVSRRSQINGLASNRSESSERG